MFFCFPGLERLKLEPGFAEGVWSPGAAAAVAGDLR